MLSLLDCDVKVPNSTFYGGREHKKTLFFFFLWTYQQSFRIQLPKNRQHLTNWKCWNESDKVWNSADSLFGCRFRSRCRRRCFSSLISPVHNVPLKEGGQIQTYCSSLNCWQVAPFLQGFGSHLFMAGNEEIEIYFSINSLLIGLLD